MNRPVSRQALALWLTGLVVVALLALVVYWGLAPSLAPQRGAVPVVALPADLAAGRGVASTALPEVQRVALDPEGLSEVVVRNVEGQFLDAEAEAGGRRIRIRGSGWIPASSGAVTVSAAGYVPATVALGDAKVEVVLRPAYRVEGTISDVVTKERLSGVPVSLEARDANDAPLVGETDDAGRFRFAAVARGSYVLRGEPVGHVPLCADPGAESSGIGVEVVDNLQLDVPAYPVYVTLCGIHNQTNLTDAVFGALVSCTFRKQPGPSLPQWFDREVTKKIGEAASALRIANAYGQACWSRVAPDSLLGQIEFVFDGDPTRIAKDVVFQPLAEFLRRPAPVWHSLERGASLDSGMSRRLMKCVPHGLPPA